MDSPNKIQKYKKYKSTHNLAIFELQTPDFARKFIWTVQPNDKVKKYKMYKMYKKYKSTKKVLITQTFFELQTPDFAWKFVWTVPTN